MPLIRYSACVLAMAKLLCSIGSLLLCWTIAGGFLVSALSEDSFLAESSAFIPTVWATNISQRCIDDSRFYVESLNQHKDWALNSESKYLLTPLRNTFL